jgi:hypothetical protein
MAGSMIEIYDDHRAGVKGALDGMRGEPDTIAFVIASTFSVWMEASTRELGIPATRRMLREVLADAGIDLSVRE